MALRRVATPEGARFYGLPIGSPIAASLKRKVEAVKGPAPKGADKIGLGKNLPEGWRPAPGEGIHKGELVVRPKGDRWELLDLGKHPGRGDDDSLGIFDTPDEAMAKGDARTTTSDRQRRQNDPSLGGLADAMGGGLERVLEYHPLDAKREREAEDDDVSEIVRRRIEERKRRPIYAAEQVKGFEKRISVLEQQIKDLRARGKDGAVRRAVRDLDEARSALKYYRELAAYKVETSRQDDEDYLALYLSRIESGELRYHR